MKLTIVKCLMAVLTMSAAQAFADDQVATIRWTENAQTIRVTDADVKNATVPPFGYVKDLPQKQNLCYEGKDFEAVDLIFAGLNHHGTEQCDIYIIVTGPGTIVVGPCQQPSISNDLYSAEIPLCAK